jgi:DNA-binding GntR family transcriptional regulator
MAELLRDSVYRTIRRAILTCELRPGQELREQILADEYRVSRSPVRDSLLRLEQEKLVTVLPRQGYRVNMISMQDIRELYGLRLIIAPACAAEAARASDGALQVLDRFRDVSGDRLTQRQFLDHNREFHATVANLTGNTRLAAVENSMVEEFDRLILISLKTYNARWMPQAVGEHIMIIDAIRAHDGDAAFQLVYSHILAGQARHLANLPDAINIEANRTTC